MLKYFFLILITINIFAIPSLKEINNEFEIIAQKYSIPASLLKALAYKQSRWNTNYGKDDDFNKGMYGIMGLYQNNKVSSIAYGAKLLNIDPIYGLSNYKWNIEISARIISEIRDEYTRSGVEIKKVEDYYSILIDYFDYDESIKVFSEGLVIKIYKLINDGYSVSLNKEKVSILPEIINISALQSEEITRFYDSANYTNISSLEDIPFEYTANKYDGRGGTTVDQVLIHIMQGYFEGSISWFKNPSSSASSHYLISKTGEIIQMVKLEDRAWHAGTHNGRSVGIEHEGFDDSYDGVPPVTEEEYQASAMLTRWLTEKYDIPRIHRDAYHDEHGDFTPWTLKRPELADLAGILGHHDTNGKEYCPGPHWNWDYYMSLVNESTGEGEIEVIMPLPNEIVDNPVVFKCKVDGDIVKVKYFADDTFLLGESTDKDNNFRIEYPFNGIGIRTVNFKAYDENGSMIYSATKSHDIEIVEAGDGTIVFKTPLNNSESVNPVILEASASGNVVKVKYFAEDSIFLGESTDKDNNFKVERAFNQIGLRILNAKGYNSNDVLISNAEDEVSVTVLKIDGTVIEECIPECDVFKETKCNINGNISICEEIESCLIWQIYEECGGDEYCEEGKCLRRETDRECDDECTFVNQKECNGNSVRVCKLDQDNCLKYYLDTTCQDGFVCQAGSCIDKNKVENSASDDSCSFSNGSNSNNQNYFLFFILLLFFIKLFNMRKRV